MAKTVSDVIRHPVVFRSPARFMIEGAIEKLNREAEGLYLYLRGKEEVGMKGEKDDEVREAVEVLVDMLGYMRKTAACVEQVFNDDRFLRLKLAELGGEEGNEPLRQSFP